MGIKDNSALNCLKSLLMEIGLYGHSGVYKTNTNGMEGRRQISPTPLMTVLDPLASVAVEEVKRGIREEKRILLPKM